MNTPLQTHKHHVTLLLTEIGDISAHDNIILHDGFQTVLKQASILLVEGSILASATLYGSVEMTGTGESQTRLVIVWVLSSADGNTIGTLRQDNTVAMMSKSAALI